MTALAELEPSEPAAAAGARPESIRRRYAATLFTQILQLGVSFIVAALVPRTLGPVEYGNYNFLLNMSSTLRSFLEPSVQQAFFTFSSQDRQSGSLTKLYSLFLLGQFLLILSFIGLAALVGFTRWVWPGQMLGLILLVTVMEWAGFLALSLRQLGDSKGLTMRPQAISAATAVFTLAGIAVLVALNALNIYTYAYLNLVAALIAAAALGYLLLFRQRGLCWSGRLRGHIREHLHRWWGYAAPLIALEYYTPVVAFLSTYLVQVWYGSIQQGYFGLALRWSALVLVFTNAALMIFWREIAHATATGEHARMAYLYRRFNSLLFFVAMALSLWLSFGSSILVFALAGKDFGAAAPIVMVMAFYPVQQTFGQITTAAFKASGRTAYYRNLGFLLSLPDLALTYLLLAPRTAVVPGLGLGAMGVALRMVVYGLLSVQAYEWANHRYFGLSYARSLGEKLAGAALLSACAALTLWGGERMLRSLGNLPPLVSLALASPAYVALAGLVVALWPELIGLSRAEIVLSLRLLRQSALAAVGQK